MTTYYKLVTIRFNVICYLLKILNSSSIQLIDGLHIYQDHEKKITSLGGLRHCVYNSITGEVIHDKEEPFIYEGSHTTSIKINISANRLSISRGNPSKINRLDNLFGYQTIDQCVCIYNKILTSLGLPVFTKCTKIFQLNGDDGKRAKTVTNGAVITEIHTTTNKMVGQGNLHTYLRALSTQRLRNSIPHLATNGCTVTWLSKLGNAALIHSTVYDKANEISLHQLPKIKRQYGEDSYEYKYLKKVQQYCEQSGVARFENKFKSRFLRRNKLQYWGISDFSKLEQLQKEFIEIDKKLYIESMTMISISDLLKEKKVCNSTQSANSTAAYYFMWMEGHKFNLNLAVVKRHRARLRKINIDIAESPDVTKHNAVRIKQVRKIEVNTLSIPDWYKMPEKSHLSMVA